MTVYSIENLVTLNVQFLVSHVCILSQKYEISLFVSLIFLKMYFTSRVGM